MRLLLVEDDLNLGRVLLKTLRSAHEVEWVRTLAHARASHAERAFDLILLDLGLPDGDGGEWIESMRAAGSRTPVLVISARDDVTDRVDALNAGADDFLVKPFAVEELKARIAVLIRRELGTAGPRLIVGDLVYVVEDRQLFRCGTLVPLTPREESVLVALMRNVGRPVSRERLNGLLTGEIGSNALEVHVHSLRKLLGRERIETVRGFGYTLRSE